MAKWNRQCLLILWQSSRNFMGSMGTAEVILFFFTILHALFDGSCCMKRYSSWQISLPAWFFTSYNHHTCPHVLTIIPHPANGLNGHRQNYADQCQPGVNLDVGMQPHVCISVSSSCCCSEEMTNQHVNSVVIDITYHKSCDQEAQPCMCWIPLLSQSWET